MLSGYNNLVVKLNSAAVIALLCWAARDNVSFKESKNILAIKIDSR